MVTPYLEKLIHEGKAVWKHVSLGISSAPLLKVPNDSYIVITEFTYFNFIDYPNPKMIPVESFDEMMRRSVHQVKFTSKTSDNVFVIKDGFDHNYAGETDQINYAQINSNGHVQFQTYMLHSEDVKISIVIAPPTDFFNLPVILQTPPDDRTKRKPPPEDFGTVSAATNVNVITDFFDNVPVPPLTGFSYFPAGYPSVVPIGFPFVNEYLRFPVDAATDLQAPNPGTYEFWRNVPIINLSYVLIKENKPTNITGN